jgi:membrane protein implicated in regulation of membrane protease activity
METTATFFKPEVIWFLAGIVMLFLEFILPGFIIAFFGVGAIIVGLVCIIAEPSLNLQLLIFLVASVVLLVLLRKWVKTLFLGHTKSKQDLNREMDEFVGEKAVVKAKITPEKDGKVELHGTDWHAEANEEIEEGVTVKVVAKDNITLKVKKL